MIKRCKNKECNKVLPLGYKEKYCQACMNKKVDNTKKGLKIFAGVTSVVGVVVIGTKKIIDIAKDRLL